MGRYEQLHVFSGLHVAFIGIVFDSIHPSPLPLTFPPNLSAPTLHPHLSSFTSHPSPLPLTFLPNLSAPTLDPHLSCLTSHPSPLPLTFPPNLLGPTPLTLTSHPYPNTLSPLTLPPHPSPYALSSHPFTPIPQPHLLSFLPTHATIHYHLLASPLGPVTFLLLLPLALSIFGWGLLASYIICSLKGQYHGRYHEFWPKLTKFKL